MILLELPSTLARAFRPVLLAAAPAWMSAALAFSAAAAQDVQLQPALAATPASQAKVGARPPSIAPLSLDTANPFDKDRQVWADRVPPPPPPARPPAPPEVTDQDMQVYGIIIVGESKRATVKVGKRFAHLSSSGRPFANLTEGQTLGEFILSAVRPDHLVLFAPGGEQRLYFTPKSDRAAGPGQLATAPPPVQGATGAPPEPAGQGGQPPAAPLGGGSAPPAPSGVPQGQGAAPAAAPAPAAQPFNLRNSLAAALEAARNGAQQSGSSGSGTASNPFQKP